MCSSLKDGTTAGKNMKVSSGGLGSVVGFKGFISFFALRTAKKAVKWKQCIKIWISIKDEALGQLYWHIHQKASRGRCTARYWTLGCSLQHQRGRFLWAPHRVLNNQSASLKTHILQTVTCVSSSFSALWKPAEWGGAVWPNDVTHHVTDARLNTLQLNFISAKKSSVYFHLNKQLFYLH